MSLMSTFAQTIRVPSISPIVVSHELLSAQNVQQNVCYYLDEEGRHHCVCVNVLQFSQTAFNNLQNARGMSLTINLDTDEGPLTGVCWGTINHHCLLNAIQP